MRAAETAVDANALMLAEQDDYVEPLMTVNTKSFGSGYAPSGILLSDYLDDPVYTTLHGIKQGRSLSDALGLGENLLVMLSTLGIMDTARSAAGLDISTRPAVGYVRLEEASCCDRCMILAGKWYRWNEGFLRHPHCHGRHVPSKGFDKAKHNGWISDPKEAFDTLSPEQQDKRFGPSNAQAIRDGADIYQVVNSKRGTLKGLTNGRWSVTTNEGMTRYGWSNMLAQQSGRPLKRRLTPEAIYTFSHGDRDMALQLLQRNGYLIPKDWRSKVPNIRKSMWLHDNTYRQGRHVSMSAAQKRLQDSRLRYEAALSGRNPYDVHQPVTPNLLSQLERDYRHWKTSGGNIFSE